MKKAWGLGLESFVLNKLRFFFSLGNEEVAG
jgi:hypothetical protein